MVEKKDTKQDKRYRHFEIISQKADQAKEIKNKILSLISEDGKVVENNEIVQRAFAEHDKDKKWVEKPGEKAKLVDVPINWHLSFSFKNPHTVSQTANLFGVDENMVEIQHCRVRHQSSKINAANYIAYLMHATEDPREGKHHYKLSEIDMYGYGDEENLESDVKKAVIRSVKPKIVKSKEAYFDDIATGKISRDELVEAKKHFFVNPYLNILYRTYEQQVNDAIREYITDRAKTNRNICKQVILITGPSGSGKTYYMKNFLQKIFHVEDYDVCESSGNNDVLNEYSGEKVLQIDDCRLSELNLTFDEILRLTDNHNYSALPSRYHNKLVCADYIVFTTSQSIDDFLGDVYKGKNEKEDKWQLPRRIQTIINIGYEKIGFYKLKPNCTNDDYFDDKKKKTGSFENYYQFQCSIDNPNKEVREKEAEQENTVIDDLVEMSKQKI